LPVFVLAAAAVLSYRDRRVIAVIAVIVPTLKAESPFSRSWI